MVDYRLQSKTNAPFLTPKLRVTQRNIMILHSFVGSSPYPFILYALPSYTIRPTPLYHTSYSFIPHALFIYTILPIPLYYTPYSSIPYALPIYTTRPATLYHTPCHFIPHAPPIYYYTPYPFILKK